MSRRGRPGGGVSCGAAAGAGAPAAEPAEEAAEDDGADGPPALPTSWRGAEGPSDGHHEHPAIPALAASAARARA
ncbi:hypothetical protein [Sorangium sp. So ce426]|uniref:hypothetical protein n=1 Tax=Sorangium sp. So ce426 TaxID=3133312 RepID=UPI003F5B91B1